MLTIKTEAKPVRVIADKAQSSDPVIQNNTLMHDEETLELDKEEIGKLRSILANYGCDSSQETVSLLCKGVMQVTPVKPHSLVHLSTIELQQSLLVFLTFQPIDGRSPTHELLTPINDCCIPFFRRPAAKSVKVAADQETVKKLRVRRK